jgi:ketosteroid isomerase-like protein
MSRSETEAVVRAFYDALGRRDLDAIAPLIAADFVNHAAGDTVGPEAFARLGEVIDDTFGADAVRTVEDFFAGEDRVCVRERMRGHHRASGLPLFAGLPPTGIPIEWTFIHIWRVADGQIVEHWAERNDLALRGAVAAAAEAAGS